MANEAPWNAALGMTRTPSDENVLEPAAYRLMLSEIGFVDVDCYYHAFRHPMNSPAEIVEFVRATALRRFLDQLPSEKHLDFVNELTRRLEDAYGTRGPLTFNFRRLFLWARRPDDER
jgi:trans-aconitate 2-methyltransferase